MYTELTSLVLMAEHNRRMNKKVYSASAKLSEKELSGDRGAFFKSVLGTLNHILVGDILWLKRFAAFSSSHGALSYIKSLDMPQSLRAILFSELAELRVEREKIDESILQWVEGLTEADLTVCISYTSTSGAAFSKQLGFLIQHLFLHQVHHRGQVTTLLSQSGLDVGSTDIIELVPDCSS